MGAWRNLIEGFESWTAETADACEDGRIIQIPRGHLSVPAIARRATVLMLVLCPMAACAFPPSALAGRRIAPDGRCRPAGQVLARGVGVAAWKASTARGAVVVACAPSSGIVHRVPHAGPKTARIAAAGHYLAFEYDGGHSAFLDVFDALTGHTELDHLVGNTCYTGGGGSDNVCGGDAWVLSSTGWVAALDSQGDFPTAALAGESGSQLVATDGQLTVTDLDGEGAEDLRVSGSTVSWALHETGVRYSAPLGPQLDALARGSTPVSSPPSMPCTLIMEADASPILGALVQAPASSSTTCTYTRVAQPSSKLTLTLETNLSAAQVSSAEAAAERAESYYYKGPPRFANHAWSATWITTTNGLRTNHTVRFTGGVELALELTTNALDEELGPPTLNWSPEGASEHFTDLALDRLMGWDPVPAG